VERGNPSRKPISVGGLVETTLHFLITKEEALRHPDGPRIAGEFRSGGRFVDLCFVRELDGSGAIASFALKIISKDDNRKWRASESKPASENEG
jgi:hypothetical protein